MLDVIKGIITIKQVLHDLKVSFHDPPNSIRNLDKRRHKLALNFPLGLLIFSNPKLYYYLL